MVEGAGRRAWGRAGLAGDVDAEFSGVRVPSVIGLLARAVLKRAAVGVPA
jgi:hypothetical protein